MVDVEQRGEVTQAELAAGLIDWKAFQDTYKDRWLECARRAFAELDSSGTGELGAEEIAGAFCSHLSPYEVRGGSQPGLWPGWARQLAQLGAGVLCCVARLMALACCSGALLSALACAQVDAALHQALLEATGMVDHPAAAAAASGGGAGVGAAPGAAALVLDTRISFEHFLGMLHDPSGVQDLEGFEDRWVGGGWTGGREGVRGGRSAGCVPGCCCCCCTCRASCGAAHLQSNCPAAALC